MERSGRWNCARMNAYNLVLKSYLGPCTYDVCKFLGLLDPLPLISRNLSLLGRDSQEKKLVEKFVEI